MPWYSLVVFLTLTAVAGFHAIQALRNLSNGWGAFSAVVSRGPFAQRRYFTEKGWRHRNLALLIQPLAFVIAALLWLAIDSKA